MRVFARIAYLNLVVWAWLAVRPLQAQTPGCDVYLVFCLRETAPSLARANAEQALARAMAQAQPVEEYRALQALIAVGEQEKDAEAIRRYSQRAHALAQKIGPKAQETVLAEISRAKDVFADPAKRKNLPAYYSALLAATAQADPAHQMTVRLKLAQALLQANLPDQSRLHLEAAAPLLSSLASARDLQSLYHQGLAQTHLALNQPVKAQSETQKAITLADEDSVVVGAHFWAGRAAASLGLTLEANAHLSKALDKVLKKGDQAQFRILYEQLKAEMDKAQAAGKPNRSLSAMVEKYKMASMEHTVEQQKEVSGRIEASTKREQTRMWAMYTQLKKSYDTIINNFIYLVAGALAILLGLVWWSRRRFKNMNALLKKQGGDILEKNRMLEHQNKLLQVLNTDKSDLMSMLAHDMRAPLNSVVGLSQLVEMEGNLNGDQQLYMQKIHETVHRANQMIRELLDVNVIEQQATVAFSPVDLPQLVNDLIADQRRAAQAKDIRLFVSSGMRAGQLHTAPDLLKRVVENLLTNAIKFSPQHKNIYVSLTETTDQVAISVRDEGPGLHPEDHQRLFRKFQKLSAQPTGGEASTGLGLAIVKALTEKLKGNIRVESEFGNGANFIVTLPRQAADQATGGR
jgi:signal transduction histidine kinase